MTKAPYRFGFKVLTDTGHSPVSWVKYPKPGVWTKKRQVAMCKSGWHLAIGRSLHEWINWHGTAFRMQVWAAEGRGAWDFRLTADSTEAKMVFSQVRLLYRLPFPENWLVYRRNYISPQEVVNCIAEWQKQKLIRLEYV